jgi:hypothetical protein
MILGHFFSIQKIFNPINKSVQAENGDFFKLDSSKIEKFKFNVPDFLKAGDNKQLLCDLKTSSRF